MLHWRLLLGFTFIVALVALCWLDHVIPLPGAVLMPLAIVLVLLAGDEMLRMLAAVGMRPSPGAVHAGNFLLVVSSWISIGEAAPGTLTLLALGIVVFFVFAAEIRRYEAPGKATANAAAGLFAVVYVGLLMSFAVTLRMIWGVGALASLLIVVKFGDTGAYTVGRLVGRHKLAPQISPGKTIEGALGGLVFSAVGSWATFHWLVPLMAGRPPGESGWGWLVFGLAVSAAGMLGDLAESLIKRDAGQKDSSRRFLSNSFGGVLDLLDSLLLAAPVAYAFWAFGLVGR